MMGLCIAGKNKCSGECVSETPGTWSHLPRIDDKLPLIFVEGESCPRLELFQRCVLVWVADDA